MKDPIAAMAQAVRNAQESKHLDAAARDEAKLRQWRDAARAELLVASLTAVEREHVTAVLESPTLGAQDAYCVWVGLCSITSSHARLGKVLDGIRPAQRTLFAQERVG
jgi:hypothetical protein